MTITLIVLIVALAAVIITAAILGGRDGWVEEIDPNHPDALGSLDLLERDGPRSGTSTRLSPGRPDVDVPEPPTPEH